MATTRIDPIKKTFTITASAEEYLAIIGPLITAAGVLDFRITAALNTLLMDAHISKAGLALVRKVRKSVGDDILLLTACDLLAGKPKAIEIESTTEPVKPEEPDAPAEIKNSSTETQTE